MEESFPVHMSQELAGKVAIITGAGRMRSIGRPIARMLARAGAAIVITGTGRRPEDYPDDEKAAGWRDIESVAQEVRSEGARCLALVSDIRDERAVEELVARTVGELGRVISSSTMPAPHVVLTLWRRPSCPSRFGARFSRPMSTGHSCSHARRRAA